jgi:hypothetical protein
MGAKFEEVIWITRNVIFQIWEEEKEENRKNDTHTEVDLLGEVEAVKGGSRVNKAVCSVNSPKGTL